MEAYNWEEYLDFANSLLKGDSAVNCSDETKIRIAISRAYYAAYHVADDYLRHNGEMVCGQGAHDSVIQGFKSLAKKKKHASKEYNQISNDLNSLKMSRQRADYEAEWHESGKFAQVRCKIAQKVIERVKSLK